MRRLYYFPSLQGEIFLGHTTSGYLVVPGFGPGFREMGFGFILHTPERAYQVSVGFCMPNSRLDTLHISRN